MQVTIKKCEICGRTEQECRDEERGEITEHKIDSSWKYSLICDECWCDIVESCY